MTVHEAQSADGWLTYRGNRLEIADLLQERARQRDEVRDPFTAAALRQAADRIRSGQLAGFEMVMMARFVVSEDVDDGPQPAPAHKTSAGHA